METENKLKIYNKIVTRGDIVWLRKDLSFNLGENVQDIHRPYVVISNNTNNDLCPTINLACLTKKIGKANYPMHVLIYGAKYGLDFNSVIYVEQIITINKKEIADNIARLDANDLKKLDKAIYIQLIDEKQTIFA